MDLTSTLRNCLDSNNDIRRPAEESIQQAPNNLLFQQLLPFLNTNLDVGIKILVFTIIKTRIRSSWFIRDHTSKNFLDDEIKNQIKATLCMLLANFEDPFHHPTVMNQLMDVIHLILSYEQGQRDENSLQSMLIKVASNLSKDQTPTVQPKDFLLNILIVSAIVKPDRFNNEGAPLFNEITLTFGNWYQWGVNVNFNCNNVNHLNRILYPLFKLFHHLFLLNIPEPLNNEDQLTFWTNKVIDSFSYKDGQVSKWGLKFLLTIFKKVSNKSNKLNINLTQFLSEKLAPQLIYTLLSNKLDDLCLQDQPKVRDQLTQLLMISLLNTNTYLQLKPQLESIINKLIIPSMTVSQDDIDEFEDDPLSFINKLSNDSDTIYQQFIKLLLSNDTELKGPILDLTINLIQSNDDSSVVCGCNLLVCLLQSLSTDQITQMIQMILNINSSIISNDRLWLRCYLYEVLTYVTDPGLIITIDPQMPLPLIISSLKLLIFKKMKYNVVEIMSLLLHLSSIYPLEIIYELIDLIVLHHPQEIQPFNLDLIDKLTENFLSICQGGEEDDQIDQLTNIMNNFVTIVISMHNPQAFDQINARVSKVVNIVMSNGILDLLTESMELLETINFMTRSVLNLDLVIQSFKTFGIDYPDLYQVYMESVYQYGQRPETDQMTQLILWIYEDDLHIDDWELNEVLLSVICQMIIHPEIESNYELTNEAFTRTLQTSYEIVEEKENFFQQKLVLRCVIGGLIHKLPLVLKLFGNQLSTILNSLTILINKNTWSTVFDLKLGILGLCGLASCDGINDSIKSSTIELIMIMVNKLEPAIQHRMTLMKMESGETHEDVELTYDEEYDELNRETRIDSLNVVDIVRSTLHI